MTEVTHLLRRHVERDGTQIDFRVGLDAGQHEEDACGERRGTGRAEHIIKK